MSLILSGTDGLSDVDGSAATPAIRGTDANTGIFFPAADTIAFAEGGVESMRIDASGNVGIGQTSPTSRLHVKGTDVKLTFETNTGASSYIQQLSAAPYNVSFFNQNAGSLIFGTNDTERARIDSSGNLLVGSATSGISNGGIQALPAGGGASIPFFGVGGNSSSDSNISNAIYSTSLAQYQFYVGYGGTVFARSTVISSLSDARLKENIVDLDVGLDKIMALKPRKFDWKEGKGNNKKNVRGFIAQELEQVFPDLIDEWRDPAPEGEDPYKSVRQDLMPVLVKAIQEQQALITTLTARITALEGA